MGKGYVVCTVYQGRQHSGPTYRFYKDFEYEQNEHLLGANEVKNIYQGFTKGDNVTKQGDKCHPNVYIVH